MLNGKHGGNDLAHDVKLDLSANLNPLGMPERVRRAVLDSACDWEKYPDPECRALRVKLSESLGIRYENIVCGNGADDLIYRIVSALRPRRALILAPTFSEYRKALEEHSCEVCEHMLSSDNGFAVTERILSDIDNVDMVFIAFPNNPTGAVIGTELLKKIAETCEKNRAYLVCDESFIDFAEDAVEVTALNALKLNMIVLRSFTKIFAIAGLRLGYAVCGSSETAAAIKNTGQYWSVSVPAQAAGKAALDEKEYLRETVRFVANEREYLSSELSRGGFEVYPSAANYLLFRAFKSLGQLLLDEGILIRSCADYSGLDESFFRIAVRTHDENMRFAAAVRRALNG